MWDLCSRPVVYRTVGNAVAGTPTALSGNFCLVDAQGRLRPDRWRQVAEATTALAPALLLTAAGTRVGASIERMAVPAIG